MFKKCLSVILILLAILCFGIQSSLAVSYVNNAGIQPLWTYIDTATNHLDINASGKASMSSQITADSNYVDNVTMNNYLQRNVNGSWTTVSSWSQNTASYYANWSKTYYVTSGYYYRLYTFYYVYDGSTFLEGTTVISSLVYY